MMSNSFDPDVAVEQQKAIGRARRRAAGADMTLDDAEERYDAIWKYVVAVRYGGPFLVSILIGWMGPAAMHPWAVSYGGAGLTLAAAVGAGNLAGATLGKFHPGIKTKVENFWMLAGGALVSLLGMLTLSPGVVLTGASILAVPLWWEKWSERVMANTDFNRLRHAQRDTAPPQLME
jgi:hypothetical protein